uniref:Uncharacterized protein n=1 Tax=Romanomermis culicivorax TaxID=13658 RepID=A0A915K9L0_ROMCU
MHKRKDDQYTQKTKEKNTHKEKKDSRHEALAQFIPKMPSEKVYVKWGKNGHQTDGTSNWVSRYLIKNKSLLKLKDQIHATFNGKPWIGQILKFERPVSIKAKSAKIRDNATATGQSTAKILAVSNLHDNEEMERYES